MTHVILHDPSGTFLITRKDSSQGLLIYFEKKVRLSTEEMVSRAVYREVTGEESDNSADSPITVRYAVESDLEEEFLKVHVAEPICERSELSLRKEYVWTKLDEMLMSQLEKNYRPLVVRMIRNIATETSEGFKADTVPWFCAGGYPKKARDAIRSRVTSYGRTITDPIEQRGTNTDSKIFEFVVEDTVWYYKISGYGSPEALITKTLAKLAPDYVVSPFGVDTEENSFFTEYFGFTVYECFCGTGDENVGKQMKYCEAVNAIAEFHMAAIGFVGEMKAIGMEDTSPQKLRSELPQFVTDLHSRSILDEGQVVTITNLLPEAVSMLNILIDGKIPLTVCHGDLTDGNITATGVSKRPLLFDWYRSSLSHPFLDFLNGSFEEQSFSLTEVYVIRWHEYDGRITQEKLMELMSIAKELVPLWETYRIVKLRDKSGHQLNAETDHSLCVTLMDEFIDTIRSRKNALAHKEG